VKITFRNVEQENRTAPARVTCCAMRVALVMDCVFSAKTRSAVK
jgi:hypothetical protein